VSWKAGKIHDTVYLLHQNSTTVKTTAQQLLGWPTVAEKQT